MTRIDLDSYPCVTVEGTPVRIGDVVWALRVSHVPKCRVVNRDLLRVWRVWNLHKNHYADRVLAFRVAKAAAEKRLAAAKRAVKSELRTLARLRTESTP